MKEGLIERINRTDSFEDDLFFEIIETEDILERTQFIEAVRRKCQEVGRLREFNNPMSSF